MFALFPLFYSTSEEEMKVSSEKFMNISAQYHNFGQGQLIFHLFTVLFYIKIFFCCYLFYMSIHLFFLQKTFFLNVIFTLHHLFGWLVKQQFIGQIQNDSGYVIALRQPLLFLHLFVNEKRMKRSLRYF